MARISTSLRRTPGTAFADRQSSITVNSNEAASRTAATSTTSFAKATSEKAMIPAIPMNSERRSIIVLSEIYRTANSPLTSRQTASEMLRK